MGSFERKLGHLLESATEQGAITQNNADALTAFMKSDDYAHKGWFNLTRAMGGLGGLVMFFGISMIVANNWHGLSDVTKISGFIVLLGSSHFLGLYAAHKGYDKMAQGIHLLGAGLVLVGIGLVAQIFHLHSHQGTAYLTWAVLITPLAVVLRNGPIALMSLIAFVLWGNNYMDYTLTDKITSSVIFNFSTAALAVTTGLYLRYKESTISSYIQVPGIVSLIFISYILGFMHNSGYHIDFSHNFHLLPSIILFLSAISCVYLYMIKREQVFSRYFILAIGCNIATAVLIYTLFLFGFDKESYFTRYAFGWTSKVYYPSLIISIFAWVAYFSLVFWGVIYGALHHHRWMLNCNIVLLGIGIFTRFIDLIGNMMDTGIMFIVCGLALFVIGFFLERWRRRLISDTPVREGV